MSTPADPALESKGVILVVDDTPANLLLLSQMLTQHGYKTRAANSGVHALAAIQANPPDLVLLDVMMSTTLEGVDLSRKMAADSGLKDIPIIMISSIDCPGIRIEFLHFVFYIIGIQNSYGGWDINLRKPDYYAGYTIYYILATQPGDGTC